MKKPHFLLLSFSLVAASLSPGQFSASTYNITGKTYFVGPEAARHGEGTRDAPFGSLEQARDQVRKDMLATMTPPEGATIQLLPGTYFLEDTFALTHRDAFPAYSQLTIQGSEEGASILHMGKRIPLDRLDPVTDAEIRQRLRPEARAHVRVVDLTAIGLKLNPLPVLFKGLDGGQPEIFFDDQRLPIARYPNEENLTMGELISPGVWWDGKSKGGSFRFEDDRHLAWKEAIASGLRLNGFWRIPWQSWSIKVESVDTEERILTHAVPIAEGTDSNSKFAGIGSKYTRPEGSLKEPYFAFNLLEEIDRPGEWSIDYASSRLYIWLPREEGELIVGHNTKPLFALRGASQVVVRNLTFKGGRENGIEIIGGLDNVVEECRFRNLGGWGVVIRGGFRNGVRNSHFTQLGKGGIELSGGDPVHLIECHNFATGNQLHDLGILKKTWAGAIKLGVANMHGGSIGSRQAVGITVSDNVIFDLPHIGILAGGNFNEIRRNIIYDIAKKTHDVGYVYMRHDMTSRGNILTDNLFYGSPHSHGFHVDDGDSGDRFERNVIIGSNVGVQIGGGHDNIVRGNFFIDCERGAKLDDRGIARNYTLENAKKRAELKIVERAPAAWFGHFPKLRALYTDKPEWPRGNVFTQNHFVRCGNNAIYDIREPGLLETIQARNTVEQNVFHEPSALPGDEAAVAEYFRDYLRKHGKMPGHLGCFPPID